MPKKKPVKKPLFEFPKVDRKKALRDLKARLSTDLDGGIGDHKHRWYVSHWIGSVAVGFRCSARSMDPSGQCEAQVERMMTKEELAVYREHQGHFLRERPERNVHRVWHDFLKKFREQAYKDENDNIVPERWRWIGYDLMQRIERWAKNHPKDVTILGCDDDHHSSSLIALIEHKAARRYMGTTMLFVPQHGGEPAEIFLYPGHRVELIAALTALHKPMLAAKKAEVEDRKLADKAWNKVVKKPSSKWEAK